MYTWMTSINWDFWMELIYWWLLWNISIDGEGFVRFIYKKVLKNQKIKYSQEFCNIPPLPARKFIDFYFFIEILEFKLQKIIWISIANQKQEKIISIANSPLLWMWAKFGKLQWLFSMMWNSIKIIGIGFVSFWLLCCWFIKFIGILWKL